MEIEGKVIVVTGGASGIGKALCERFARSARGVVVADLDGEAAAAVAQAIGGMAFQVNVGVEAEVQALIAAATERFGQVDVVCSNAGIIVRADEDAPNADWQRHWDVNVMAHVYAARAALPQMLARGEGYFVHTASAAGLLSQVNAAPYSVTKHAAVGFAEWLSIAHGDQGIRVSCLCPQGVLTPMLMGKDGSKKNMSFLAPGAVTPEAVAEAVVLAMREERFLVLPHEEVLTFLQRKAGDYDRWLRGMRKLREKVMAMLPGQDLMDATQPVLVEVLPQHRIDATAVVAHLRAFLPASFDGEVVVRQFQGGQSNPTYHLATNVGSWVLRKKPPGKLLPSAHAVEREYRVMKALEGSGVPVPHMLCLCEDAAVIGTPFFVMERVEGRLMGARFVTGDSSAEHKHALYDDLARVLATLHRVDWKARGLADFGRPERFLERQVARWAAQWEASRTEELPAMERLRAWLPKHLPSEDEASLVHGDYRLGNVLVHPTEPRIATVLDWELATLGHPLADLGYLCLMYQLPPSEGGCAGADLKALGVPTQDELVAAYARHAQRDLPKLDVFIVFSLFRLAGILAGVYKRALDGNASDARAIQQGERYRAVAQIGWELAQRSS